VEEYHLCFIEIDTKSGVRELRVAVWIHIGWLRAIGRTLSPGP
jgi:hypothetical protein